MNVTESRKAFEAALTKRMPVSAKNIPDFFARFDGGESPDYIHHDVGMAWWMWEEQAELHRREHEDMAMLIRQVIRALRHLDRYHLLAQHATDYLVKNGLNGEILRSATK